ncbi:XrtA/PEP-CTERM system exopolysaccharide export protein [Wenzhouxiangella sp. XN24]|uniref:XrtA/PEP-CTERM system exopolysaccharide export protein n=1 Tax=Wenzhouxiangella sp. XN24 TaxID=2713569 RepID=UPI0013EA455C|nr:XrtA/PEP-CTERM system exopolysaccharide export protein [Wenzhouxiangella sp. XN24]NGX17076.1 sugar ABC transporter substrate-binding protein [Wenzhouxiangella sp. XN24]
MRMMLLKTGLAMLVVTALAVLAGCGTSGRAPELPDSALPAAETDYIIAPGAVLNVFVWQHPDLSTTVPVRPDGKISTPLIEDMVAAGKTPTQLARDMEEVLARFIRQPTVNVIMQTAAPSFQQQVRVVGQAANAQALPYSDGMTLLDVMIQVGGLGEFAAGNRAKLVRRTTDGPVEINVRLDDLLNAGDMRQNVVIQPGDVIIIPEARF